MVHEEHMQILSNTFHVESIESICPSVSINQRKNIVIDNNYVLY